MFNNCQNKKLVMLYMDFFRKEKIKSLPTRKLLFVFEFNRFIGTWAF